MRALDRLLLPQARTASPSEGDLRWDPTGNFAECYDGSAWKRVGPTSMPYGAAFDPTQIPSGAKFENPRMPIGNADNQHAVEATGAVLLSAGPTVPAGMSVSGVRFFAQAASVALTHSYAGICTGPLDGTPRTVLARSADDTSNWGATLYRNFTWSAWTPTVDTGIYVFLVVAATTTMPRLLGRGFSTGAQFSASGGVFQYGQSSTAVQTAAPAAATQVGAVLGAINSAAQGDLYWYCS
jgi:hypothetical protein